MRPIFTKYLTTVILLFGVSLFFLNPMYGYAKSSKGSGKGWLGVYIQDLDDDMKEAKKLKSTDGVLVDDVVEDSPAEKGGIKAGDVIVKFNGEDAHSDSKLRKLIRKASPGDEVEIVVVRDGDKKKLKVVLSEAAEKSYSYTMWNDDDEHEIVFNFGKDGWGSKAGLGVVIEDLNEQLGEYFGVKNGDGILIDEVLEDSPAKKAGLKAGDVIVKVDGKDVEDIDELREILAEKEDGEKIEVVVLREKKSKDFRVELSEEFGSAGNFARIANLPRSFVIDVPDIPDVEVDVDVQELKKSMKELKKELKQLKEELKKELKDIDVD
ncbi:MAG: PDZ domain-containing protein [candidate division Zixibacteria bacterium]|nr:PDZ domain-containing protein [candidate division Zixibacteria bacterium]